MKLSLKSLMNTLSEAASFANERLSRDCVATIQKMKSENLPMPPLAPLHVANMRVSFSAQVSATEQAMFHEGGDMQLDFSKPDGNFKGEIVFSPYDPGASYDPDMMAPPAIGSGPPSSPPPMQNPAPPSTPPSSPPISDPVMAEGFENNINYV